MFERRIPSDKLVHSAQRAIDTHATNESREWLQMLLDILKAGEHARIECANGLQVDVSKIAYTFTYASFYDVFNHMGYFNLETLPAVIDELVNPVWNYYANDGNIMNF